MEIREKRRASIAVTSLLLMVSVAAVDAVLPLGIAFAILYLPAVLITLWSPDRRDPLIAAGACTVLTLAGYFVSPSTGNEGMALGNRGLSVFAIWVTAIGCYQSKLVDVDVRDREAALRAILETAVEGIITIDRRGIVLSFNPAAESMFGYTPEEVIGRNVNLLMPEPYHSEHDGYVRNYLETGERKIIGIGREVTGLRRDGTRFPLYLGVSELQDGRGFAGILRDITEERRAQKQFHQAQKQEAIGRLASGIAHDFNNLLAGIIGCCRIAADGLGDQDGASAEQVREIREAAERGTALTRQLLTFSRRGTEEPQPILLDRAIETVETLLQRLLGEDVRLVTSLASESAVVADPGQIEQVLLNLAVNARDAMPGGGTLRVTTRRAPDGDQVVLEVADDGAGMPEEVREKVFEPFFTTKADTEGTGLGLATVYGIVQQLGGHIHLESEVGRGTTFRIHLPRTDAAVPDSAAAPAPETGPVAGEGPRTILVVEDDRLVRAGIRHQLTALGYEVLLAGDGQEALRVCDEHEGTIDLLLTDIVMPGMGGGQLAKHVAERVPGIQALFMSALPEETLVEQGRLDAGLPTIQKPFDEESLASLVRELLEG